MKIGEISKKTEVSQYTLRYYEKKELIRVKRNNLGIRDYSEDDIEWIKFIKRLKDTGMKLKDIKKYSNLRYVGDDTILERLKMLVIHRDEIVKEQRKWEEYLNNIDKKINIYKVKLKNKK